MATKFRMDDEAMKILVYVCAQCKAEDKLRFFPHENFYPVINCWKCHAGYQHEIPAMMAQRNGMFPKGSVAR